MKSDGYGVVGLPLLVVQGTIYTALALETEYIHTCLHVAYSMCCICSTFVSHLVLFVLAVL